MVIDFQELVEKGAIVDYGLTHFFGAGFPPLPSQRKRASGAVILNHDRMINRQVVRAQIELCKWVTPRGHHLRDELVGLGDSAVGVVHEARLDATPFARKRLRLIVSELAKIETADALGALSENRIGLSGTDGLDGSLVLGSKAFAQVRAAAPRRVSPGGKPQQDGNDGYTDEHERL